ncbi:hypothetical protein HA402_011806 [Bradysia odoriphaga]|nr:hypothetical protein HA402_011806 [Bradysia odoriphaga]
MALLKPLTFCKHSIQSAVSSCRNIQTTAALAYKREMEKKWHKVIPTLNTKWREDRGLPINPNAHGPLTDLPDYTFMDGSRPTPLGSNQKKRIIKQRELTQRMVTLIKEVDDAKLSYQLAQEKKQQTKQEIIANKLKPKGVLLIKK